MSENVDRIEKTPDRNLEDTSAMLAELRKEIDGSQDDLFSIMNALQFQDITTQQINSIANTINKVQGALHELLMGFEEDGADISFMKELVFDPNAEFDFNRSAESQRFVDDCFRRQKTHENVPDGQEGEIVYGDDGQPDISSIRNYIDQNIKND